jgi:uncharacterized membrane protein
VVQQRLGSGKGGEERGAGRAGGGRYYHFTITSTITFIVTITITNMCINTYYYYELYYYGVRYLEMDNWGQHNGTSANLAFNNMMEYSINTHNIT